MKLNLDTTTQDWQKKASRFAVEELIPCELEAEMNQGRLAPGVSKRHKKWPLSWVSARWMFRASTVALSCES